MPRKLKHSQRPVIYHWFDNELDRQRHLWFVRSRAQAEFRGESWQLTYEDFCCYWPDRETMDRRGRQSSSLCLTRYDDQGPWSRDNVCMVTRNLHMKIKNRRTNNMDCEEFFREAIWI